MRTECPLETEAQYEGLELRGIHCMNLVYVALKGFLRPRMVRAKGPIKGWNHFTVVLVYIRNVFIPM